MNQLKIQAQTALYDVWDDQGITNYVFSLNTGAPEDVDYIVEI